MIDEKLYIKILERLYSLKDEYGNNASMYQTFVQLQILNVIKTYCNHDLTKVNYSYYIEKLEKDGIYHIAFNEFEIKRNKILKILRKEKLDNINSD